MPPSRHILQFCKATLSSAALLSFEQASAIGTEQTTNPIRQIARAFDPQLVKTENRISWLNSQVSALAQAREHTLKTGLGYRGYRSKVGGPDPNVCIDLGAEYLISAIFLVPAQGEFLKDPGIFPKRFTLEVSNREDFSRCTMLYTSGNDRTPLSSNGTPVLFKTHDKARYVRLTVHEGHNKGMLDLFGLSEIAVISEQEPISFGAKVTTLGDLNSPGIWYPEALTDGRTPLGIWQKSEKTTANMGDVVDVSDGSEPVSWTLFLTHTAPLDRIILFPYEFDGSSESSVFSDGFTVHLQATDGSNEELAYEWHNPLPASSSMTPLVIPLRGKEAKYIRITGTSPCLMGDMRVHALSEIEVWSKGKNLAKNLQILRHHGNDQTFITALTDGNASGKTILPFPVWLEQLHDRGRMEQELSLLRPIQRQLAATSELNTIWGCAVVLGLSFFVPIFLIERRRLLSRDQLDQLRKRIASDLHDDIGSNLGSISLIARTARKDLVRLKGPGIIADDLGEVESIARESSLAMRDIVWLLEQRQDSIGDLVQRMRDTAGRLLREIHYTLECESSKTTAKLSLDAKRHLFLFYKEAIHNVLKHSQANRVSIRLWDKDDQLALEILDDGIGIPLDEEKAPASIRKLEDRARVLDGLLQIASSRESGTKILLFVKCSHLTAHPTLI